MISGTRMGAGNNSENSASRPIICKPTINIVMHSQSKKENQPPSSKKNHHQVDLYK